MTHKTTRIRLAHPQFSSTLLARIGSILESGRLTKGSVRERFEEAIAAACHVRHAVTFNSGTSALVTALQALSIGSGDRVAVPDYTFVATVNAVEMAGAIPVFLDVDADDFGLSPKALEEVETPLKAVIVVHQFGIPAKMGSIADWAKHRNVPLVEDAACAIGSAYRGRSCGAFGRLAVLSFHPRKVVTTGEGGAVLTDEAHFAALARSLSDHGFAPDGNQVRPGCNLRLPEISCAIGMDQIERLDGIIEHRRRLGEHYRRVLERCDALMLPAVASDCTWNHQTFVSVFRKRGYRDDMIRWLDRNNVESNAPAASVSLMTYYRKKYDVPERAVRVSRMLADQAFSLPCHDGMTDEDVQYVADAVLAFPKMRDAQ